ncbi:hypothetical protein CVT24_000891 [Panaeolus cyanescens]|uniref:Uncharacterized protein n=1 Tax=Panaeolus cyanescens TaxID=181874 RepID=A0A409YTE3_9AGAR|nr:hypothetical protein CVT24_000891 [Panaeolus cyanescens]
MQSEPNDLQIKQLGSKFDVEVREEASYILWHIWRSTRPEFATLQACIDVLSCHEKLYVLLKKAHRLGRYDSVRAWSGHTPYLSFSQDDKAESQISTYLDKLRPALIRLVSGEISLPNWTTSISQFQDPQVVEHLNGLRIPCLKGKPNLLLHDLGHFKQSPDLQTRLNNIFMPNNHTFLVNTSGSGKTRLLLEGLCQQWGFYFTSLVDSSLLGSSDVQNCIHTHVPDSAKFRHILPPPESAAYDAALKTNRDIANRVFQQVFLARLLVFNVFAEIMIEHAKTANSTCQPDPQTYRQRWLLLQLQPSIIDPEVWDVFDDLSSKLANTSDCFINTNTKSLLCRVRKLCSKLPEMTTSHSDNGLSTASHNNTPAYDAGQTPIFCVLDEAQHAATQLNSAFRSDQNGAHRPILREIVKAWEGQSFGQGIFMVVAGTGISKDVVDQAMASAIMKDSRYRWCSDTGAFDREEVQRRYLEKYFPPALIRSTSGSRLLQRIWYWLHGRYRFTAGYVSELIMNGFRRPHGLLNAYVNYFTDYTITDAAPFLKSEGSSPLPILSKYRWDFSKLKKNSDMLSTIHQLTSHYLIRAELPATLGRDEAIYVEYGFARFADPETKTVVVDEPLVLLSATRWINKNHQTTYKCFAKQITQHTPTSNGFENYIAFCLDMIFSTKRTLSDVFSFCGKAPIWAEQEAELVALHRTRLGVIEQGVVRHYACSGTSVSLGINCKSPEATSSWLDHSSYTPICFPHISMGPDLIFALKLSDGSLIWVALQAKYSLGKSGLLSRSSLRRAMQSVTPNRFYIDKDGNRFSPSSHPFLIEETRRSLLSLPRRRTDAGKYSLLRVVVSFPAATNLKRGLEEDPDDEGHPIASLNVDLLKQVTRKLSPTDLLQGLEDPLKNSGKSGKRKRGEDKPRNRPKKIKLNQEA